MYYLFLFVINALVNTFVFYYYLVKRMKIGKLQKRKEKQIVI